MTRPRFRARAPLRISFAGGGTDVPPFPSDEGGCVLSATIDRYAYGSLDPRTDRMVTIESVDFKTTTEMTLDGEILNDGSLDLIKSAVRRFGREGTDGYDLVLRSSAPPGSGLGSSSTMMVALTGLLAQHYGVPLGEYETAELAFTIERGDLGITGGMQDLYAATFGGFNFIEFTDHVIVNPLRIREEIALELELSLLLCFTGMTRDSARVIEDQTRRATTGVADTLAGLRAQKELAVAMKAALLTGKLHEFGVLLGEAWSQKKRMSPYITNERIDGLYDLALRHGALGGKLTGAGGGGYILLFCDFAKKHRLIEALEHAGAAASEFAFESRGLTTWPA
ncbi:GHMP family kinase ATP-binding protein [Mycobacterium sp. HUMS_1102779]|uniref:GHMP family kinase ATP-binding protein n=1 Tax=Mycobacterium sp. HUMS_1102779 TaxID=3383487 RepID=UPI00389AE4A0